MAVGTFLSTHRLRHGELKRLAEHVETTTRTLRTWRGREGRSGSPGHPRHSEAARRRARILTKRVWRSLVRGHDGWPSVIAALERRKLFVPTRLVQESLRALKQDAAQRARSRIEEGRVHVDVLAKDAIWAIDQTHLCRDRNGPVKALVVRDCLSQRMLGASIGAPARGVDVVHLLLQIAEQRGTWPFVIQADNGSENKNAEVAECLHRARVHVLWNEPRTPQHNPRAERGMGDLKLALGLEKARDSRARRVIPPTEGSVCVRLLNAWAALDTASPRDRLDGLTPVELDRIAPRADDRVRRDRFYAEVCEELRRVALAPENARARRKATREAIWSALEKYGMVYRTRGGCPIPTLEGEEIP
jgi:hypothetical protein